MSNPVKYAETLKFHKKKSELQVKIAKPEADESGRITRRGCVFFEIANAIDPNAQDTRMDWNNKIVMKIGVNDIAQILYGLRTRQPEIKLYHQNDAGSSSCNIKAGNEGSFGFSIFKKVGEQSSNSSLFLSGPDVLVLCSLLEASLPVTQGWS